MKILIENILEKFQIDVIDYDGIVKYYSEPHRFFHTMKHVERLIEGILACDFLGDSEKEILILTAIYHDIIYNPQNKNNEEKSAELLKEHTRIPSNIGITMACDIILNTKTHKKTGNILVDTFLDLDMETISKTTFVKMLQYERKVFKEYQFVDYKTYKEERIKFLENVSQEPYGQKNTENIKLLIDWIKNSSIKVGVYAGSFNPFHQGHKNILNKSQQIFDKVVLAIGINPEKSTDLHYVDTLKRNVNYLRERLNVEVCFYDGLLTDFIQEKQTEDNIEITLIRGLRDGFDLSYENKQLQFMRDIYPDLRYVYIQSDREFDHISSSSIKIVQKYNPELAKKYLI